MPERAMTERMLDVLGIACGVFGGLLLYALLGTFVMARLIRWGVA